MTSAQATYTWSYLLQAVPAPTPAQAALYAIDVAPGDLIERGTRIRSEKILTDLVRFGGITAEFWPKATPAQRKLLLGFSDALLRVFVHAGKRLADLVEQRSLSIEGRERNRAAALAIAEATYAEGMAERERLATTLEGVADHAAGLAERVDKARSRVVDAQTLASSLAALVMLARELIAEAESKVALQLFDGGLTTEDLDASEALAARVKSTSEKAAGARTQGGVTQADLDLQDGICLLYMERVMKAWNRAHEQDPSIPQLMPITTRRLLGTTRRRAAAAEPG
ncbi:hypothetical protein [Polyangium spumosum]|uniref:Uncharacterized protein n=1 Tax=Polyangium spumosum TaxID=889282 RepID=A0A6N7PFK2_9BACT|nr:hypothetical protein [Polyangium spumosum]MRG90597.1 hypothetical protein [Polyangium spumosum]